MVLIYNRVESFGNLAEAMLSSACERNSEKYEQKKKEYTAALQEEFGVILSSISEISDIFEQLKPIHNKGVVNLTKKEEMAVNDARYYADMFRIYTSILDEVNVGVRSSDLASIRQSLDSLEGIYKECREYADELSEICKSFANDFIRLDGLVSKATGKGELILDKIVTIDKGELLSLFLYARTKIKEKFSNRPDIAELVISEMPLYSIVRPKQK